MFKKVFIAITVLLVLSGFIVSFVTKGNYVMIALDENKFPDYPIDSLNTTNDINKYILELDQSISLEPFAARISFNGERKLSDFSMKSKVKVLEVYKGDKSLIGKTISTYEKNFFWLKGGIFRVSSPCNLMTKDNDYLVFGNIETNPYDKEENIILTSYQKYNTLIFRVKENKDIIFDKEKVKNGEVKFSEVEQNEFLVDTKDFQDALIILKDKYFKQYNIT